MRKNEGLKLLDKDSLEKITKSANSQIAGLMRASANRLSIFANTMTRRMKDEAFGKRKILTTLQFLS